MTVAAGAALDFYSHSMEMQDTELATKRREEAKISHLVEVGEESGSVQMTTFHKNRKSRRENPMDTRGGCKPTRKVHQCSDPSVCVACRNKFKNLKRGTENKDQARDTKTQETNIIVDQTHFESWIPMGCPEDTTSVEDKTKAEVKARESNGWDTTTLHEVSEPSPRPTTSASNALDNAILARDSLVELEPVPALTRNNSNTSADSFFGPLTPRETSSPPPAISSPDTTIAQDDFETVPLNQAAEPKLLAKLTSSESDGLDNASLHRDMPSLRSAHAVLINHEPTTGTASTQSSKSTNASIRAQLVSVLHTTFSLACTRPVITASTAVCPLLTATSSSCEHSYPRRRAIAAVSSYTITSQQPILSSQNCQSLHTHSTILPSEALPCRFTHDSYMENFLHNPSSWMGGGGVGDDFCAHSVIRNAQDARDGEIGVLELREWKKVPKHKKKYPRSEQQEEEDRARDKWRLRKAKGLEPEACMAQESFGRMF